MTLKNAVKYASLDALHSKDVHSKNVSRKRGESKSAKMGRRSKSLDRIMDDSSGDLREDRQNRRQFMHLISEKNDQIEKLIKRVTTLHSLNNEFAVEHAKLESELVAIRQRCSNYESERERGCEPCRTLTKQNETNRLEIDRLSTENEQLTSDISMMKVLIYRLNVQLEHYQEVLRKQDVDGKHCMGRNSYEGGSTTTINYENVESIDWGCVQSHVLAPLLNAYQETIREKNHLAKQYESELNQITGRIKDIVAENDRLHGKMETLKQCNDTWNAEKVRMQAQVDACRKKTEIQSKRADLAKEKLLEVMRCYEQKLQSQSIDIQRLQVAHGRLKNEQSNCQTMHQQPELVVESLKERQRLFDETKAQYDTEKTKYIEEIAQLKETNLELNTESKHLQLDISEQKSQIDLQKERISALEKKMEKLRARFMRMQQSRDMMKSRLHSAITWNRKVEAAAKTISWQDLHKIEQLIIQKDTQLQQLRAQYQNEIEKFQRKLHRRDEMLRKILLNKVKKKT